MFDNSMQMNQDGHHFERDKTSADEEFKSIGSSSLMQKNEDVSMNLSQIQQFQPDLSVCQSSNSKKKIKIKSKKQTKTMTFQHEDQSSQTDSNKMQEQIPQ